MNRNWSKKIATITGAMAALVAVGILSVPANAQNSGAATYKAKCVACHGADGQGDTAVGKTNKIRDLGSADVQQQSDADLTTIISAGKGKMPAYGKSLKPDQIKDLVAYIRSLKK
jgi:cytochrome c6